MRSALLDPILDDSGKFISDSKARAERLKGAVSNSVYESTGESAPMILGAHSRALQAFCQRYGRLPNDEILASAHQAIENAMIVGKTGNGLPGVFESADMSTTEGVMMRDRMVSLILPVLLQSVTAQMTTLIPGQFNRSEMFRVHRVAGSTFGDLQAGDRIDFRYNGRYAVMDQMSAPYLGDASKKQFVFDSATDRGKLMPIKPGSVKILHDRNIVAHDDNNGHILGVFALAGATINISGTVDYSTGKVTVDFSAAPAAGIEIHIGYDVDIEKDYKLIPKIDHQMESRVLVPHESAITGSVTLQALWGLRREFGLDADNLAMSGMRNLLAADKDRKILRDMYFFARDVVEWNRTPNENLTLREHYESLNSALLELDSALMKRNGISGLWAWWATALPSMSSVISRPRSFRPRRAIAVYRNLTMWAASSVSSTSTVTPIRKNTPALPSPAARSTARPAMSAAMPCPLLHSATPFWAISSPVPRCGTWLTVTSSPLTGVTI